MSLEDEFFARDDTVQASLPTSAPGTPAIPCDPATEAVLLDSR